MFKVKNNFIKFISFSLIIAILISPSFLIQVNSENIDNSNIINEEILTSKNNLEVLAQKAIESVNELAENLPELYGYLQHCTIVNVRELYTPVAITIIAYIFELQDNTENYGYVIMNPLTQKDMEIGNSKSPCLTYLEKNNKEKLTDNEKFIYSFAGCHIGFIEDNDIIISDIYTDEIIMTERKNNIVNDQEYKNIINHQRDTLDRS